MKPRLLSALALPLAISLATAAQAGSVQVTVTGQDGRPAANVAVQVNSASRSTARPSAATPVLIEQRNLQFAPYLSMVQTGSTVRFINRDAYDHHVRSVPGGPLGSVAPAKDFELRLGPVDGNKAASADVVLDKGGIVGLGCHLHGSMRGHVLVTDTPWFGKTDDKGRANVEGVPDGPAELVIWHPDQLTGQAAQQLQIGSAAVTATAQLNFTPKTPRRAAPPPYPEYN